MAYQFWKLVGECFTWWPGLWGYIDYCSPNRSDISSAITIYNEGEFRQDKGCAELLLTA